MCGIFCLLNNQNTFDDIEINNEFMKGSSRGPEIFTIEEYNPFITIFGFHRLPINGLNPTSNQPMKLLNCILICNGEIYNYKQLYKLMDIVGKTDSDCEIIIHLYKRYGIEETVTLLDGVFAFVLYDIENSLIYVSRDPFGVRPLYYLSSQIVNKEVKICFASEIKSIIHFKQRLKGQYKIIPFPPSSIMKLSTKKLSLNRFINCFKESINRWFIDELHPYFTLGSCTTFCSAYFFIDTILADIRYCLIDAVTKRVISTERPIACLLSGGLDSSLITALVNNLHKTISKEPLETYSIGLENSVDLKYARMVSKYLKTKHTEIIVTEEDLFNTIPSVIRTIESYDVTTVRASLGNYLLGKFISQNSKAKVIFNGDGSNELTGAYLYMGLAPDCIEFDKETRRLLKDIHYFDILRSDRCISSHGLEPRTPFLDKTFVQNYLSIPPELRYHKGMDQCEKFLLRKAFDDSDLLPQKIIWRRKEAFSYDNEKRSFFSIIPEKIAELPSAKYINSLYKNDPLIDSLEKKYYRYIFDNEFPDCSLVIPYYWIPKYIKTNNTSAQTLDIYK